MTSIFAKIWQWEFSLKRRHHDMFKVWILYTFSMCLTTKINYKLLREYFQQKFCLQPRTVEGANSPIKCFDSLQEFVICFEKKSSLLRFLNRIEVASFHFPSSKGLNVCVWGYIFQCSMQRSSLSPPLLQRPKMASDDGALQKGRKSQVDQRPSHPFQLFSK